MKTTRLIGCGFVLVGVSVALAAPTKKSPTSTRVGISQPGTRALPSSDIERPEAVEPTEPSESILPENQTGSEPEIFDIETSSTPSALDPAIPLIGDQVTPAGGDPINLNWYSINNGGAIEVSAGNIKMGLSIGQNAVGEVSAGNIKMGLGFWYGAAGCNCDCHADPNLCDNDVDVFDIVNTIEVAFRGFPSILDPNPLCPVERTDVDSDGDTDVFDITKLINVAFRGMSEESQFVNPCAPAAAISATSSQSPAWTE